MNTNVLRKSLAIGIILLFVGIVFIPSAPGNLLNDDTTPQITAIALDGTMGNDNWFISNVNISFYATDNQSGVNITYYALDSGEWTIYIHPFTVTANYMHLIKYYSVDNAGNVEDVKSEYFKIDKTPPEVWFAVEKIRCGKFLIYAEANDDVSGMDRVEFYIDDIFKTKVIKPPYLWIYTGSTGFSEVIGYDRAGNSYLPQLPLGSESYFLNRMTGMITNVTISEESVSFYAILVLTHYSGILWKTQITLPNSYVGYLGKFFMNVVFFPM